MAVGARPCRQQCTEIRITQVTLAKIALVQVDYVCSIVDVKTWGEH